MFAGKLGNTAARALVVSSVAGLVMAAAPARADRPCQTAQRQRTLELKVRSQDNTLRLGDTAKFSVSVVRDAEQILEDQRISGARDRGFVAERMPAEGADVIISLSNDFAVYGGSVTDEDGKATVKVRVDRHMKLGRADLDAYARISYDTPCHLGPVEEWGEFSRTGYARITG